MIAVNGREYPLWSQFVENKEKFLGQDLEEIPSDFDKNILGLKEIAITPIKDIVLKENGENSAFFKVIGEDFSSGFDVKVGGIIPGDKGFITFSGYGDHVFRIRLK